MYTATSKTVLDPLADAVSNLIVIVSDAESRNAAIPDLTGLATGVKTQVDNLVQVGRRIQDQQSSDSTLKQDMGYACDVVTESSQLLVDSSRSLRLDPLSKQGMQSLLDSVKGILNGTSQILNVFDDSEVRKILSACGILKNFLSEISAGPAIDDAGAQKFVSSIAAASQNIVFVAQLASKRINELLFPSLQARLRAAINSLKSESPLLISACKVALSKPNDQGAIQSRILSCNLIIHLVEEIETVVQYVTEEDAIDVYNKLSHNPELGSADAQKAKNYTSDGNSSIISASIDKYLTDNAKFVDQCKERAQIFRNEHPELDEFLKDVERAEENLLIAKAHLLENPTDIGAQHAVNAAIDALLARTTALESCLNQAYVSEAADVFAQIGNHNEEHTTTNNFHKAALSGNKVELAAATKSFDNALDDFDQVIDFAIEGCNKPEIAMELTAIKGRQRMRAEGLKNAATLLNANTQDATVAELYNGLANAWDKGIKDAETIIFSPDGIVASPDIISGLKQSLDRHAANLTHATKINDDQGFLKSIAYSRAIAERYVASIKKESENTTDVEYKRELDGEATKASDIVRKFFSVSGNAFNATTAQALFAHGDELISIIGELKGQFEGLSSVIELNRRNSPFNLPPLLSLEPPEPLEAITEAPEEEEEEEKYKGPTLEQIAEELDALIIEESKPELLTEEEAKEAPIKAAGQQLKVEAANWTAQDNKIISSANSISDDFLLLHEAYVALSSDGSSTNKKRFIEVAKQISVSSQSFVNSIKPLSEVCTDRRLKNQLEQATERLTTLQQQMKILAAVKASSPSDRDKDAQLVACATNLINTTKTLLRDAESASLRVPANSEYSFKFRKQLFRFRGQ